jgi:hypothetical protein
MAFADFDLPTVRERFGLSLMEDADLFAATQDVTPSDWLRQTLDEWAPAALAMNTEKARSEMIIAPILMEVVRRADRRATLFSGPAFDVDREQGLNGTCDYLITRSPERFFVSRPVVAVVEAKREDITAGLGQCAAAMVGAQLLNARQPGGWSGAVHGAVTTGSIWRFLKLDGAVLTIDRPEYYLQQVGKILGILTGLVG